MTANTYKFSDLSEGLIFVLDTDIKEIVEGKRVRVRSIKKITPRAKFDGSIEYNAVEQKNGGKELIIAEDAVVYLSE